MIGGQRETGIAMMVRGTNVMKNGRRDGLPYVKVKETKKDRRRCQP